MKRKLVIALALALSASLILSSVALAWEYEDPCVADNEDFWNVNGWDDGEQQLGHVGKGHVGGQHPDPTKIADGWNLYRDDVTDTGNLDRVRLRTDTPDLLNLPTATRNWKWAQNDLGWMCKMEAVSPDTWYWATEPRGYDPEPVLVVPREDKTRYFTIVLPDGKLKVKRRGTIRYQDINFCDGTWLIQIPSRLRIWSSKGGAAEKIIIDGSGTILSDIRLAGSGDIVITKI